MYSEEVETNLSHEACLIYVRIAHSVIHNNVEHCGVSVSKQYTTTLTVM